jgi:hypothetical protein
MWSVNSPCKTDASSSTWSSAKRKSVPPASNSGRTDYFSNTKPRQVVLFEINRAVVRSPAIDVKISLSDVTGWPATQVLPDPDCW